MLPLRRFVYMAAALGLASPLQAQDTLIVIAGTVREVLTRTPIAAATLLIGDRETVRTNSEGRFNIRVSRTTAVVGFSAAGYLDFRYPLLRLTADSLYVDVELRTDPPAPGVYVADGFLPPVCVRLDRPDTMAISHACRLDPPPGYVRQIFKHNPWSPYFGRSVDGCGVIILMPIGRTGTAFMPGTA